MSATSVLWLETAGRSRSWPRLRETVTADAVVVGAGVVGLTAALLLQRAGLRVVVLDAGVVGDGSTGCSSAHVTEALDVPYDQLIERVGLERARDLCHAARLGVARVAKFIEELDMRCDATRVTGYRFMERGDVESLERDFEAAERLEIGCSWNRWPPLPFPTGFSIEFPGQWQFHPVKYLRGLASAFVHEGGRLFQNSRVTDMARGEECIAETANGAVRAPWMILATHTPIGLSELHGQLTPMRSAMLAFRTRTAEPHALLWDCDSPYHYIRSVTVGADHYLLVGGGDFKTGASERHEDVFEHLAHWTRERFKVGRVAHQWCAQLYEPLQALPSIGHTLKHQNVLVASGLGGVGLSLGSFAGTLLADIVRGDENSCIDAFALRPTLQLVEKLVPAANGTTGTNGASKPGGHRAARDESLPSLASGEGAIVHRAGQPIAVSRDEQGELVAVSATCTHEGCALHWNALETSWDCPCHGSRFRGSGEVIEGPATEGLEPAKVQDGVATVRGED